MRRYIEMLKTRSIIRYLIVYFIMAALLVLVTYLVFSWGKSWYTDQSFFQISDLMSDYSEELETENYSAIPLESHPGYAIMVFSQNSQVYTSDSRISFNVTDLNYVMDYYGNYYYDHEYFDDNGERYYVIKKRSYTDSDIDGKFFETEDYCKLDSNYNIVEGNLFKNSYRLDEYRIGLTNRDYKNEYYVDKAYFITENGENRAIVLFEPMEIWDTYNDSNERAAKMWWIPVILVLAIVVGMSFALEKRIHRALLPLNRAIVSYGQGKRSEIGHPETIPQEFQVVIYNFNALLDQLEQAKSDKQKAEDEKNTIIASLSHDLKTPLTVISSYSKALSDGLVPDEQKDNYLQTIYGRAIYTSNLITELFEYTKMDHPNFQPEMFVIDYAEFCNEVCGEKYSELESNGFKFSLDIPVESIPIKLDPQLMQRVFENLIGNSIKYNEPGTTIFVKVVKIGKEIRTIVGDDGVGIPEEVGKDIFKPFVRGDIARDSGKGTGLGMAVVKKIIELNGGTIELKYPPEPGYSTEYVIRFISDK